MRKENNRNRLTPELMERLKKEIGGMSLGEMLIAKLKARLVIKEIDRRLSSRGAWR